MKIAITSCAGANGCCRKMLSGTLPVPMCAEGITPKPEFVPVLAGIVQHRRRPKLIVKT
ncbi:hypothetical protein [Bradyrhizobium sp.]|uniref:hypothetical protein n=1 Tax=Bradyrhizobium sp. TaxID=376 RepID=UPI002732CC01|nr:hypothetical protein [Bradyrhizobium sp.]MDP3693859.1 hypothetical protein [Bradyrhizobium sp.]